MGLVAPQHVGSQSPDQGSNPVPGIGSQTLNHWTTREVPQWLKGLDVERGEELGLLKQIGDRYGCAGCGG